MCGLLVSDVTVFINPARYIYIYIYIYTPCLVPGPHWARPLRFGSRGLDTSPKYIDREGLGRRRTAGTGQMYNNVAKRKERLDPPGPSPYPQNTFANFSLFDKGEHMMSSPGLELVPHS